MKTYALHDFEEGLYPKLRKNPFKLISEKTSTIIDKAFEQAFTKQ